MDWLDLRDPRSQTEQTTTTPAVTTADINKAFDEIAGLFEVYPKPPPSPLKNRGKTLHLNTRKTKSK
jgi:hypothetical protein